MFLGAAARAPPPPPSCPFHGSATATRSGGAQMLSFSSNGVAGEMLQIFSPFHFPFSFSVAKILLHLWGQCSVPLSELIPAVIDCLLMGHGHDHGIPSSAKARAFGVLSRAKVAHVHYYPPCLFAFASPGHKDAIFILYAHTSPEKKLKGSLIGAASLNLACVGTRRPLVTGTVPPTVLASRVLTISVFVLVTDGVLVMKGWVCAQVPAKCRVCCRG